MGFVLPYPSTFAAPLTLIALGSKRLRIEGKRRALLVPLFLIAATVLISHPLTFLFLAVGLFACRTIQRPFSSPGSVRWGLLGLTFLVVAFRPYFPVWKLLAGESGLYETSKREMYEHVLSGIRPSLVGVPLIIAGTRTNGRHPLVLMPVILASLHAFGLISGR